MQLRPRVANFSRDSATMVLGGIDVDQYLFTALALVVAYLIAKLPLRHYPRT